MYPISNEVLALFEAEQPKVLRITGTDKNGTAITITDNDVVADSFQLDRYACNGEKLEVGTAVAAQMTLKLFNGNGQFDDIVFEGTELNVEIGIADWSQASLVVTYVPCGLFTPDIQPRRMATISLTCLDRMTKFDVAVDTTALTFPATVAGLVGQACTICGVTLAQSITTLPNASVSVSALPSVNGIITYRNIIQWCAGIMATNAWMDWNGQLRFSWYNNSTSYVSTMDNRYSSDLYENDLTLTGVVYTNDSGIEIVEGTDDYALDLTGNALAGPLIATVLPAINTAVNGFAYRPFTAAVINAPYLWPMDSVVFTDKDGNNHASVVTNVAFGVNGTTALESKGMTEAINKLQAPVGVTKEQAQLISQAMEQVETDIDDSLTQQEIFNRLTDNGAAQGLVLLNGQLYVNATYVNTGELAVQRINLNAPEDNYSFPDENDPDSLFAGQSISDGWIVQPNHDNYVTVLQCGYARLLRGKAITITAEISSTLHGGRVLSTHWETDASIVEEEAVWTTQGSSSPYTYTYTVPTNVDTFTIEFLTDGVKQIQVSLSTVLIYPENMGIDYRGLHIGEFEVDRNGNLQTYGMSLFVGAARFVGNVYFEDVKIGGALSVAGALSVGDPAGTRANIGASAAFVLTGDYTTAATIYGVLNTMALGSVATIVTRTDASNAMCGVNYDMYGTIWRNPTSTSNNYYLSMTRTSGIEQYCYVLTLTESSMSHGTVYKYTGTAV